MHVTIQINTENIMPTERSWSQKNHMIPCTLNVQNTSTYRHRKINGWLGLEELRRLGMIAKRLCFFCEC